jgi:hypothetical protein
MIGEQVKGGGESGNALFGLQISWSLKILRGDTAIRNNRTEKRYPLLNERVRG